MADSAPATVLLNRTGELAVPVRLASSGFVVDALLLLVAGAFWSRQSRHCQSSRHEGWLTAEEPAGSD